MADTTLAEALRANGRRLALLDAERAAICTELHADIQTAAALGMRQVDIVRATGYTREMIRRIVGNLDNKGRPKDSATPAP